MGNTRATRVRRLSSWLIRSSTPDLRSSFALLFRSMSYIPLSLRTSCGQPAQSYDLERHFVLASPAPARNTNSFRYPPIGGVFASSSSITRGIRSRWIIGRWKTRDGSPDAVSPALRSAGYHRIGAKVQLNNDDYFSRSGIRHRTPGQLGKWPESSMGRYLSPHARWPVAPRLPGGWHLPPRVSTRRVRFALGTTRPPDRRDCSSPALPHGLPAFTRSRGPVVLVAVLFCPGWRHRQTTRNTTDNLLLSALTRRFSGRPMEGEPLGIRDLGRMVPAGRIELPTKGL